jgi:hypothetical protein
MSDPSPANPPGVPGLSDDHTASDEDGFAACPPCAGTGEFPPTDGDTCPWCDGQGEIPADVATTLIEARRSYQGRSHG